MRWLMLVVLMCVAGCGKMRPTDPASEAEVHDVLTAYAKNPADADRQYKGKHLRMSVAGVKMSRDGNDTIATHSPPYVEPQRHAQFFFVNETEAATLAPGKTYTITGRCDGLSGNVVVFRECIANEQKPAGK